MKKIGFIIAVVGLLVGLSNSCQDGKWNDCFSGAGEDQQHTQTLPYFDRIAIDEQFEIYLVQDTACWVSIVGKENLIGAIECTVSNQTLNISQDVDCKLLKGYHIASIYVHFEHLNEVQINGNANIHAVDTLHLDTFRLEVRADMTQSDLKLNASQIDVKFHAVQGEMTMSGQVRLAYLYTSGSNHFRMSALHCQFAQINHSGLGDIHIGVSNSLNASLNKSGNLYLYDMPIQRNITIEKFATGQVYYMP